MENGAQFLNVTSVLFPLSSPVFTATSPVTKISA